MTLANDNALVLFSGGQDSTVCLAWALDRFTRVETVGFDYGQRHAVELAVRARIRDGMAALKPEWRAGLGEDHVVTIDALSAISDTALTREMEIEVADSGLPTTFVPGRNLIFFSFAGALAYRRGARHLVAGMCETDYSGYPDCRDATLQALEQGILNFSGCAVVISHDRWFLDRIATHILAFEGDSQVVWYEGNYAGYEENRKKRLGIDADTPTRLKYKPLVRK